MHKADFIGATIIIFAIGVGFGYYLAKIFFNL